MINNKNTNMSIKEKTSSDADNRLIYSKDIKKPSESKVQVKLREAKWILDPYPWF